MSISIISVKADQQLQETLENAAVSLRAEKVTEVSDYIDPTHTIQWNAEPGVTPVVIVSLDDDVEAGFATVEVFARMQNPRVGVVVASSHRDADVLFRVVKAGYSFLSLPAKVEEALDAIKRSLPVDSAHDTSKDSGKVYVFVGTSGGVGVTTIATHIGIALASEGKKPILVDHHQRLGHVALYLNIQNNGSSICDLVSNEERLDDSLLSSYVVRHVSGLDVLCSLESVAAPAEKNKDAFKKVIAFLRSRYSHVIFDSEFGDSPMPGASEFSVVAAEAERVFYVTSAEIAPMRDLVRYAEAYGKVEPKFQAVVSHEGKSPVTALSIEEKTGLKVAAKFAELSDISDAVNAGKTVDLEVRSFHESLGVLLNAIDPNGAPEEQTLPQKKSWFPWGGKRR